MDNNEGGGEDRGYRGRNNEGGGYRGRRNENDADHLMFFNFNVPKSYDKETIAAFLKDLSLNAATQSLADLRKKRDYLLQAFRELVKQEWAKLEESEHKQRMEELKRLFPVSVKIVDILPDIEELLNQPEDELLQLHRLDLNLRQTGEQQEEQLQQLQQQMQPEQQLESVLNEDAIVVPGNSRKVVTRTSYSTSGRRDRKLAKEQNNESVIKRIRNLLKNAARNYELNDGVAEPVDEELAIGMPTERTSGEQRVPTRWLSENFMRLREMRHPHFADLTELRQPMSWPLGVDKRIWLSNRQPPLALNLWFVHRAGDSDARREQRLEQDELDLELALPRQDMQSRSQNTPSHGGLLPLSVQDSGGNAAPMISSHAASLSNDGLSAVQLTSGGNQAANLSAEDIYALCPPPMPPVTPIDGDNGSGVSIGESAVAAAAASSSVPVDANLSASLALRSRHAFASTPYRTLLPAIDEEPLQQMRPSTMPRVLELNEASTAESSAGATVIEAVAVRTVDIAVSLTPPMPRDWTSIFRPRTALPSYTSGVGYDNLLTPPRGLRRRKRKRRQAGATAAAGEAAVTTAQNELEQIVNVQPPSNDEVMLDFLSNLFHQIWSEVEEPMEVAAARQVEPAPATIEITELPPGADARELIEHQPAAAEANEMLASSMSMERTTVVEVTAPQTLPSDIDGLPEGSTLALPLPEPGDRSQEQALPLPLSLDELPEMPLVTSIQIIQRPSSAVLNAGQSIADLNKSTATIESATGKSSGAKEETRLKRVERELRESLSFIVEHKHLLRLMVDHNIHLSGKQQREDQLRNRHRSATPTCINFPQSDDNEDSSEAVRYVAIPAMYTYDPQIILKMSEVKLSVMHKLIGALIRNDRVDLRAKGLFETRLEAAIGYRVLFELKAADIIMLDADARYAMLL
ncbi:sister chromatid cohesion protein solo-like isoform X1 [Drosophila navojoa]|uniref:sister chromatid cohesion protein solo-like isoform X1 n=1 Tax=Drosophila navojoa TaxID=7232 RepID=UPI0011BE3A07|nr:sister chromatid cohesion protein solo-like isoform X1 [Drosophila navojoa]